jgi:hypothetical protein
VNPVQYPDTKDMQFMDGLRYYLKDIDERTVVCRKKSNKIQRPRLGDP